MILDFSAPIIFIILIAVLAAVAIADYQEYLMQAAAVQGISVDE